MANKIQIKRANSNTSQTAPSSLDNGELALLQASKRVYIGRHNNSEVEVWHIPTLEDINARNGLTKTAQAGSDSKDNSVYLDLDVTDSTVFASTSAKGVASFSDADFSVTAGVVTVKADGIALATQTTGNYVASLVAGTGVTLQNNTGENATPTVNIGQAVATSNSPQFAGLDINGSISVSANIVGDHASNDLNISSTNASVKVEGTTFTGNNMAIGSGGTLSLAQDPTQNLHSATKQYVDAIKTGLDYKDSVRFATTENITLSGNQSIDGTTTSTNDRVLVKNQSTASQNGIYLAKTGAWVRATDFDADAEVTSGAFVFVEEGTSNGSEGWILTTTGSITVGSTSLAWSQFSAAGLVTAGGGLTKTGSVLDVVGTTNRITVNADSVDISSSYAGQNTITTVGTVGSGTWQGSTVGVAYGGSGLASYTTGDMTYASGGTTIAKLGIGANGKILQSNGSAPVWADIDGGTF